MLVWTFLVGDVKGQSGRQRHSFGKVMRRHVERTKNDYGESLVELYAMYNLFRGGTLLLHRQIHKLTWNSLNVKGRNQIDHTMIIKIIW